MDYRIKFVSHVVKPDLRFQHNKILDSLNSQITIVLFNHNPYGHIYDNHFNSRFLFIFGGSGLLCSAPAGDHTAHQPVACLTRLQGRL